MGYKWKLLNETSRKVLQRGLTQQGGMCPFALLRSFIFSPELGPDGWSSSGHLRP